MLTRRGVLGLLGLGSAGVAAEQLIEPVRKLWFVASNAPVGSRVERASLRDIIAANGPIMGTVEVSYPIHRWSGGYRSGDFEPYLEHADRVALAENDVGSWQRVTPEAEKNWRAFFERMGPSYGPRSSNHFGLIEVSE